MILAGTPALPNVVPASVEPRLDLALVVTQKIQFAQSLAAGPMPSAESVEHAAAGARLVADEIYAGGAWRGDIYGPVYTSAAALALAGAEALSAAATQIRLPQSLERHDAINRQTAVASAVLTQAIEDLTEIHEAGY